MAEDPEIQEFCEAVNEITKSLKSTGAVVQSLLDKHRTANDLEAKDGISLLSLKNHLMMSYLHSLALLIPHRILGHTLLDRTPPSEPFSSAQRSARGTGAGDLVDSIVEGRIVLEKVKVLEGRMKYQIEKLVRLATENTATVDSNVANDPLAFRPNPEALMNQDSGEAGGSDHDDDGAERDGIYHPPKLAPVPYNEPTKDKSKRRALVPGGLSGLAHLDPSNPHVESSTGLGSTPSLSSKRARELARMNDFEEENMTRLVMNKKERNKRKRDEEMIALGGAGGGSGRGDGLAEEFADVFRGIGKKSRNGDGYEELRAKGKRQGAFERSKMRQSDMDFGEEEDGPRPQRKKGKFDKGIRRR